MTTSLGYDVSSLYFDSPDLMCLSQKANGNQFKQKFRVRFYNDKPTPVFLEVKSKHGAFSRKSRHALVTNRSPLSGSLEALSSIFSEFKATSAEACDFLYNYHRFHLQPILWVQFQRKAYVCPNGSGLRLTIDQSLRGRFFSANGDDAPQRSVAFGGAADILELKFTDQVPSWLDLLLAELQLQRIGFSKYFECYSALQASVLTRSEHHKTKGTFL